VKHAVILAHPSRSSFNATVADTYVRAAEAADHEVVLRDLYAMGFQPCLGEGEIPRRGGFEAAADVQAERRLLADVDVFVLVYPLWFYLPPAILMGYVDRVFGMGFGFGPQTLRGNQPLLEGRRLLTFSSSGAPEDWLNQEGALAALRNLFDDHFAAVCGLKVMDHIHFGGIHPGIVSDRVADCQRQVEDAVKRLF
jgi:NAD(P)H dehydrogenase (quinone)